MNMFIEIIFRENPSGALTFCKWFWLRTRSLVQRGRQRMSPRAAEGERVTGSPHTTTEQAVRGTVFPLCIEEHHSMAVTTSTTAFPERKQSKGHLLLLSHCSALGIRSWEHCDMAFFGTLHSADVCEHFRQEFVWKNIFEMSPYITPRRNLRKRPWESVMFQTKPGVNTLLAHLCKHVPTIPVRPAHPQQGFPGQTTPRYGGT